MDVGIATFILAIATFASAIVIGFSNLRAAKPKHPVEPIVHEDTAARSSLSEPTTASALGRVVSNRQKVIGPSIKQKAAKWCYLLGSKLDTAYLRLYSAALLLIMSFLFGISVGIQNNISLQSITNILLLVGIIVWVVNILSWLASIKPTLNSVHLFLTWKDLSLKNGWIVGNYGLIRYFILTPFWRSQSIPISSSNMNLNSVCMTSTENGWAVGEAGTILHYRSGAWVKSLSPVDTTLSSIHMVSADEGWVVGEEGVILHYIKSSADDPNGQWEKQDNPSTSNLHSVYVSQHGEGQEGWAVGERGTILHYASGRWSASADATIAASVDLYSVYVVSPIKVWAVGKAGTILHYDGHSWKEVGSPTNKDLCSLYMGSDEEGWAVGKRGTILHYKTGKWDVQPSPTKNNLNSISIVPNDGWIVGDKQTILTYYNSRWIEWEDLQ